ncbi:MAG: cobalamin B12-binding domain-containing protein [Pseudomonadota bacterium]
MAVEPEVIPTNYQLSNNTVDGCETFDEQSKLKMMSLLDTVESNIIPRLIISHRELTDAKQDLDLQMDAAFKPKVEEFARLLIETSFDNAEQYVNEMKNTGTAVDSIYLNLFAATARKLGLMWEEDRCDFTAVTIGVGRLQELLRVFSIEACYDKESEHEHKRILLTPVPGEQHTFGLSMLIEFFNQSGWEVWGWPGVNEKNLLKLVKKECFEIVGISVYAQVHLETLASTIKLIRDSSKNKSVNIMVGGYVFAKHPELISEVGADDFASNALEALEKAEKLCRVQ